MPTIEPHRPPELPTTESAILDCTRHLQTHGLLHRSLTPTLTGITEAHSLVPALSTTLGQIARVRYGSDSIGTTLQRLHLLVGIAAGAATPSACFAPPAFRSPLDEPEVHPLQWLHLAQAVAALALAGPACPVTCALGRTLVRFLPSLTSPYPRIQPPDCLLLSYGADDFLAIASGNTAQDAVGQAGAALGRMVRLVQEAGDLWCARPAGQLLLAPHLLSGLARDEHESAIRTAWAHAMAPQPDRSPLQELLARHSTADHMVSRLDGWSDTIRAAPVGSAAQRLLHAIDRQCREDLDRALSAARFFALVRFGPSRETPASGLDRTLRMAISALSDDKSLRDAWEIQRWGQWCDVPRIGRLFPVGLCLLALAAAGEDVSESIAALLSQSRRADGWRYYDDWLGIPPDTDDLGLVLQLLPASARKTELRDALTQPVNLLLRHTRPDGCIPTWLENGLAEPPPESSPRWLGPQCIAVMANVLLGLVEARWPLAEGHLERAIAFVAHTYETTPEHGIFHHSPSYAHLLFARLWRSLDNHPEGHTARAPLDRILTRIEHALLASQRADGGWGSPQITACSLELLALRKPEGFDLHPAVLYLAGRQQSDGFWPGEPLYRCPGKDGAHQSYASRSVTTAICLQALLAARNGRRRDP